MAFTLVVRMEATILDGLNVQAQATAYLLVDPGATFDDITGLWNTWLGDLDSVTDGQIIEAAYEVVPALPDSLKTAPTSLSRVEQTGTLNFNSAGDTYRWGFAIPALSNSGTVVSGGKIVLTSGSPADVLRQLFIAGSTAVAEWTNATQQAIVSFRDSLISFRQHRGQLARNTFET